MFNFGYKCTLHIPSITFDFTLIAPVILSEESAPSFASFPIMSLLHPSYVQILEETKISVHSTEVSRIKKPVRWSVMLKRGVRARTWRVHERDGLQEDSRCKNKMDHHKCLTMEQNPTSEANGLSASQDISRHLLNRKVHCPFTNSHPLDPKKEPTVSRLYPYTIFLLTYILMLSTTRSFKWSLPIRFSDQNILCISHVSRVLHVPSMSQTLI
jgi:hypothetical protein